MQTAASQKPIIPTILKLISIFNKGCQKNSRELLIYQQPPLSEKLPFALTGCLLLINKKTCEQKPTGVRIFDNF